MKQPVFTGVCTALVTPFCQNQVNFSMLETLLQRQLDAGIDALLLCGTTGESPTLSDDEKLAIFRHAKAYVRNRCPVIAGTGSNNTAHAVALSKEAEEIGVDALLLVSPYYNRANDEGLFHHYRAIAEAVSIPIILYNVPSRTAVDIPVSVYKRLAEIPNIVGVKEASGDITKITRIRAACPEDFTIWTGNDGQIVPAMSLGAAGVISVLSNVLPEETMQMTHSALDVEFGTAGKLQIAFQPLIDLLFCEVNPIPVKAAMEELGLDCGPCRLPLGPISEANRRKIKAYLQ